MNLKTRDTPTAERPDAVASAVFRSRRLPVTSAAAIVTLLLALIVNLGIGPSGTFISAGRVVSVILDKTSVLKAIPHQPPDSDAEAIVWQLRMPRALAAILIGALLGFAGVAFQGLLMNPLADPYTVGVSAGAAVGAAIAEALGVSALLMGFAGAGIAFLAALGAVSLVYGLARLGGRVSVQTFLLAGIVVGTFLWSIIPVILVLTGRADQIQRLLYYLIGSLQAADWTRVLMLTPFTLGVGIYLFRYSTDLNLMTLGEESAAHLGVDIERFKKRVLIAGSLATAAAVSVGGIIGFVGLVVPHMARRIVGPDHRAVLPLAGLFGALLLLASDALVRVYLSEMPVGVVTSIVGAPVFCYLLRKRQAVAW